MSNRRRNLALWLVFGLGVALALLLTAPAQRPARQMAAGLEKHPELVDHARTVPPFAHEELVLAAAGRYGLDPLLVLAVIEAESGHRHQLMSPRGAVGLMQVRPEVAAWAGVPDISDPAANLEAGCRLLARLLDSFGGDVVLALAAYNAGPAAVRRWGTLPPYQETRQFISKVAAAYERLAGRPLPSLYPRTRTSAGI